MYAELENIVYEMLQSWNLPEWMKKDMQEVHSTTNQANYLSQKEDDLITFSKLWASYYEAYFSNTLYLDVYRPAMETITKKMEQ